MAVEVILIVDFSGIAVVSIEVATERDSGPVGIREDAAVPASGALQRSLEERGLDAATLACGGKGLWALVLSRTNEDGVSGLAIVILAVGTEVFFVVEVGRSCIVAALCNGELFSCTSFMGKMDWYGMHREPAVR